MADEYSVGDLVAEFLELCGVKAGFGLVSVHNIPILDAIARRDRIRFVMARGELGAGHMADGYARTADSLGLLITSTGPGAAGAVSGLLEARVAGTPLLHLTGQIPSRFLDQRVGTTHEVPAQLAMLASVGKAALRITSSEAALGVLMEAATVALTAPQGPVSVEIPIDIQRQSVDRPRIFDSFVLPLPQPRAPTTKEMAQLVDDVLQTRRPMLWLGRGAKHASEAATRLMDMGFAMATSWNGKGIVDEEHPQNFGTLSGNGLEAMEKFYESVDLMVVAGSRLRGQETGDFSLPLPCMAQIDVDPLAQGRTYPATLFLCADATVTLTALADALEAHGYRAEDGFPLEVGRLRDGVRTAYAGTLGPYSGFAATLRDVVPHGASWVRDITISHSTWGSRLFPLRSPHLNVYPVTAGIGQGLTLGIGACVAKPGGRTVVLTGDGGFFLNFGELWTAIQERLNLTIIVMNDRGYGVIRQIQDKLAGGRRSFDTLLAPEIGDVAQIAGIRAYRVDAVETLADAVAAAIASPGVNIVEVDMDTIGAHPPFFPFAPKIPAIPERSA